MRYLSSLHLPGEDAEWRFRLDIKATCYETIYPFYLFPQLGIQDIYFAPITIFCGGNGTGKSTLLNILAECMHLNRDTAYNRSSFFDQYVSMCTVEFEEEPPNDSCIVTSDDVFDFMLGIRALNQGLDNRREELLTDYFSLKHESFQIRSIDDYDKLHRINSARSKTYSKFVRAESKPNIKEQSNGESALLYFQEHIKNDSLVLLDEPENSLSTENQAKLAEFLIESARYCGCQLIISTHSPFLLSIPGAKIIDLDNGGKTAERWTDIKNVRLLYDFFMKHRREFD